MTVQMRFPSTWSAVAVATIIAAASVGGWIETGFDWSALLFLIGGAAVLIRAFFVKLTIDQEQLLVVGWFSKKEVMLRDIREFSTMDYDGIMVRGVATPHIQCIRIETKSGSQNSFRSTAGTPRGTRRRVRTLNQYVG